ncbi:hypothetical protein, partial [Aliivibrio fischeri]|uniref:hypothetical protein n=1 Tax=Aliivibrio fischeri TaxID=668 RepID=UPI001969D677
VRQLTIIAKSSWISETNLRFNCSWFCLILSLHQCFALSIFNPNCGKDIWFISSKLAETNRLNGARKRIASFRSFCS